MRKTYFLHLNQGAANNSIPTITDVIIGVIKIMTITFKAACRFAVFAAVASLLSGCVSELISARQQALDLPLQITIRVLDENGQPIPDTVALAVQPLNVGEKLFCINLYGGSCATFWNMHVFKGEVGPDGEETFPIKYATSLTVQVALPCSDPKGNRRYFTRHIKWSDLSTQRVFIMDGDWDPAKGYYAGSLPCSTTTPPLRGWDDYY
ncbi:hypothetical protein [Pseudomonas sp. Irchel 3A5]|uniref:hypothetical protein n=1 Tax=Pseudomonas sp. Irchel 3A5 TaxID=2008911 RepID=UPI0011408B72|nr:hypothetical protein [Pseudomonas sp. Irchel 3A5]